MVFRRNTLKNTKTFKQINRTSSGTSNINTLSTKQNIPTPQTTKHVSGSGSRSEEPKRQTYKTNSTKEWSLSSIFPEIVPNEAYAETGETSIPESPVTSPQYNDPNSALVNPQKYTDKDGGYDMKSASADSGSEKIHPVNKQPNWIDTQVANFYDWRDENFTIRPESNKYVDVSAAGDPPPEEELAAVPPAVIPELKDNVKPDPMRKGAQGYGGIKDKSGQWVSSSIPEGFTIGTTIDFVPVTKDKTFGNEYRTSLYNLPSNVTPQKHQEALNKQSTYKFENYIQKSFSTMLSGSGPGNRFNEDNFSDLKSQINSSNISQSKKDDMISEYTNKITKYQKVAGGYGTETPWSFGTSGAPKNPNKAEKLKKKILAGEATAREMKQYSILTQTPLGPNLKKDNNFGGYEQFL